MRTVTSPSYGCGPRIRCGSWCDARDQRLQLVDRDGLARLGRVPLRHVDSSPVRSLAMACSGIATQVGRLRVS